MKRRINSNKISEKKSSFSQIVQEMTAKKNKAFLTYQIKNNLVISKD